MSTQPSSPERKQELNEWGEAFTETTDFNQENAAHKEGLQQRAVRSGFGKYWELQQENKGKRRRKGPTAGKKSRRRGGPN